MPLPLLPLIPAAVIGGTGLVVGAVLGGDRNDAQVIVAPSESGSVNINQLALMAGVAVAAVVIVPRLLK